jgi:probable phosphoglycerate mutase
MLPRHTPLVSCAATLCPSPVTAAKTTHVWIARHGQTKANREGRFCGHSETDLTETGLAQAAALRDRLASTTFAAAYTSDFSRAIATAAVVLEGRGITPRAEPGLREIWYGQWEMQRESEIRKRSPEQHALMRAEDPAWHPDGGETMAMVRARTAAALRRIAAAHKGSHVLVISHGTAIACMLSEVLAMAPTHTLRIETANCGLTLLTVRGDRVGIELLNETHFLAAANGKRS